MSKEGAAHHPYRDLKLLGGFRLDESNRMAADWVRQQIASLMAGPPEITAGEVKAHTTA